MNALDTEIDRYNAIYKDWLALWRKMVHPEVHGYPTEEEAQRYVVLAGRKRLSLAEIERLRETK